MKVQNERLGLQAGSLALLTAILWGGNSVAIKIALAGFPPLAIAFIRFFLGGLTVWIWARAIGVSLKMVPGEKKPLFGLATLFFFQIYLLNSGTHHTLAGRSTVLISTHPFFTATFAHFFLLGDRLTRLKILGMALSLAGVALIFSESLLLGAHPYLIGDGMVLLSAVLLGGRQVYLKRLTQNMHPARILIWQAGLSLPAFLLLSLLFERDFPFAIDASILSALLYQGLVIAGFCFIILTSLIRRHQASKLAVFGFITPVFGVLLSKFLLGEGLSSALLSGMVLVAIGIAIVNHES
ncbi:MAG: DMT family transporter [bacterium]|nr:DMT family transporter [bacterium]